jgi:hypothetical protein
LHLPLDIRYGVRVTVEPQKLLHRLAILECPNHEIRAPAIRYELLLAITQFAAVVLYFDQGRAVELAHNQIGERITDLARVVNAAPEEPEEADYLSVIGVTAFSHLKGV